MQIVSGVTLDTKQIIRNASDGPLMEAFLLIAIGQFTLNVIAAPESYEQELEQYIPEVTLAQWVDTAKEVEQLLLTLNT